MNTRLIRCRCCFDDGTRCEIFLVAASTSAALDALQAVYGDHMRRAGACVA